MLGCLWLHLRVLTARRRVIIQERGALSTEAVVITAALAAMAIAVVAIIVEKVTARAESLNLDG